MIDLFEKCRKPSLASELKEKGIYPYFHALESRQAPEVHGGPPPHHAGLQ